jgi:ubiquinone/menaquinone biosynthesis C-methylase UbiE
VVDGLVSPLNSVTHWESYYRGGRIAACPTGQDLNYTLELHDVWSEFFSGLADAACLLDIGTGNGAISLIARQTADSLGRTYEIHGADLAQINPCRDVADGARLFAGITFHPGIAAETLPFAAASFGAVSGQYALEYTDTRQSLAQVLRVLKPGAAAQFVMHHAGSIIVARAHASLRHADDVLLNSKVHRKLRRFLDAEQRSRDAARGAWQDLAAALSLLRSSGRADADRLVIDVTLDAVPKLLDSRRGLSRAALDREIDSVENDLRNFVRRLHDLVAAASTDSAMAECARRARSLGFVDVRYGPIYHARRALVGWRFQLRKPA